MKNRTIIIVAIALGLLTSLLIYRYIRNVEASLNNIAYGQVIVAATDIGGKTLINSNLLEVMKVPVDYIHPSALRHMEQAIGSITTTSLVKGEQVLSQKISKPNEQKDGLAYDLSIGKRAVSVAVDEVSGIEGFIKPGDYVDVATTVNIQEPGAQKETPYSLMVLQDIEVLAVGKTVEEKTENKATVEYKTITLAVSPVDSIPLILASQKGTIRLLLRSPVDRGIVTTTPFAAANFLK